MKIYLASMLEPENFGSGKIYALARTKPDELEVAGLYAHLTPKDEFIEKYKQIQLDYIQDIPESVSEAQVKASEYFNTVFYDQLKSFLIELNKAAKEENKKMVDLLPFEDGDTLVSWERFGNTNYRGTVGGLLKKIGYDVVVK
jgi:hypothetical protein